MEPVTLRTERLVLSIPTTHDVDAIYAACQDPEIQRYTTVPSPYERSHAEGFIPLVAKNWETGAELTWAVREGSTLAGVIGMYRLAGSAGEIGYWMAAGARGRGVLTEAARAVVDWSFDELSLERIEWRAVVGNAGSARVAQKLGFTYEGLLRQALSSPRGRDDGWIAGLLAGDDRSAKPWPVLDD